MEDLEPEELASKVYKISPSKPHKYSPVLGADSDVSEFDNINDPPLEEHENEDGFDDTPQISQNPSYKEQFHSRELASRLCYKIEKKLALPLDRPEIAKQYAKGIAKLTKLSKLDETLMEDIYELGLMSILLAATEKIVRYYPLLNEALHCIVPFVRNLTLRPRSLPLFVSRSGITFCMQALRVHMKYPEVRIHAVELLAASIEHIIHANNTKNSKFSREYTHHHLLLHGATSTLPELMKHFTEASYDLGTRRTLLVLYFVLQESRPEVASAMALMDRGSLLRSCLAALRNMSEPTQLLATKVTIGSMVAEKLVEMRGWDDLSHMLSKPDIDLKDLPKEWMEGCIHMVRMIRARDFNSDLQIPTALPGLDMTNLEEERHIHTAPESMPSLSALPNSYWLNIDRPKENAPMTAPLADSPYGDFARVVRKHQQQRQKIQENIKNRKTPLHRPRTQVAKMNIGTMSKASSRTSKSASKPHRRPRDPEPIAIPNQYVATASRLFGNISSDSPVPVEEATSAIDKLSFAERLQVMILQVQDSGGEQT